MCRSKINILDVHFDNLTKEELNKKVERNLKMHIQTKIFTPNTDIVSKCQNDKKSKDMLNSANILIADGVGIIYASKILRTPLPERLAGIELGEYIMSIASKKGYSVFLLGGKQGIANQAKKQIEKKYKNIKICGTHHGYFNVTSNENEALILELKKIKPDIIFVCMGFPRQEKWISENIYKIPSISIAIGLGGSLDVWSGNINRAPIFFRKVSLEWLWRIIIEPTRIKFLSEVPTFFIKILSQKYSKKGNY